MFDEKLAQQLADLSKIAFDNNELENMTAQMSHIIQLMDKVKEFKATDENFRTEATPYTYLRADEANPSLATEKITQNAKEVKNNSFVVPKVV